MPPLIHLSDAEIAARAARNVPANPNPLCRDFEPKAAPAEFWCQTCGWNEPMHGEDRYREAIAAELQHLTSRPSGDR